MKVYVIVLPYGYIDSSIEVHADKDTSIARAKAIAIDCQYDPEDYSEVDVSAYQRQGIVFMAEYHCDEPPIIVYERDLIS